MESSSLNCDLWVVGELGMVDVHTFNSLIALWRETTESSSACLCRRFCSVTTTHTRSPKCRKILCVLVCLVVHGIQWSIRCDDPELLGFQSYIRRSQPSDGEVRDFFRELIVDSAVIDVSLGVAWATLPEAVVLAATTDHGAHS